MTINDLFALLVIGRRVAVLDGRIVSILSAIAVVVTFFVIIRGRLYGR